MSLFFLSNSDISKVSAYEVIPGGENVGIEVQANGVLVIGSYDVITQKGTYNPSKDSDILKNDLIVKANNKSIKSIDGLLDALKCDSDMNVELSIIRDSRNIQRNLKLIETSQAKTFKTGLLVKERVLGIGTMTFYDPQTKVFGALGHRLMDSDFANIADVNSGTIFESIVTGVNKSKNRQVGEILANIKENEELGNVFLNTDYGVFGYYDYAPDKDALTVARKEEIRLGKAYIYTELVENEIKKYEIDITSLAKQENIATKGITFKITDDELLSKSGGIVQGMSGSPIIQDGKIIGAVTHVLIDSVKRGYGIYLDTMLKVANIGN